jgi:hypothetical protein
MPAAWLSGYAACNQEILRANPMGKKFVLLCLCVWVLSACNLAVRTPDSAASGLTAENLARSGQDHMETASAGSGNRTLVTRCYPPADWPLHIVAPGDTLSGIAVRSNSTAVELAAANCIADPNMLVAGRSIRVRQLPIAPTPTSAALDSMEQNQNASVQ